MSALLSRRQFLQALALLSAGIAYPHFVGKSESARDPGAPNILILIFDAVATKNMSLYGYRRETTPNLLRFAEKATVYHAHYSAASFTTPGVASLLTGAYSWSHRAFHLHGTMDPEYVQKNLFHLFAEGGYHRIGYSHNLLVTSLLHQLREDLEVFKQTRDLCLVDDQFADRVFPRDFTAAFWSEWLLMHGGEFQPGSLFFSLLHQALRRIHKQQLTTAYGDLFPRGLPELHNLYFILEDAIDWLQTLVTTAPQPYLAYVHLLPPHEPYNARRDFVGRFADGWAPPPKPAHSLGYRHSDDFLNQKRQEYDEYLAYADSEFGRLYDFMEQSGVLDNTYVVVTSDHGEMFERGILGHITPVLYDPVIRIPLLISRPGQQERQDILTPTLSVDLLPTLLHATGRPMPDWIEGSLLPAFGGDEENGARSFFVVEAKQNAKYAPLTKGAVALIRGRHKLIRYLGHPDYEYEYEFYDLDNDPEELENLYPAGPPLAPEMVDELDEKLREVNQPWTRGGSRKRAPTIYRS